MAVSQSPFLKFRGSDNNGNPSSGGLLFTYAAGTSNKLATFTDSTGSTPNTNPIVLNSRGECDLFLTSNLQYKFVLSPPNDTDPPTNAFWTEDNVVGIGSSASFASLALPSGSSIVGYDGGTVQDVLDSAKPMQSYTALRAYTGRATSVRLTPSGISGYFLRSLTDVTSADDGGTIIIDGSGRRWFRLYGGAVDVRWFGAVADGVADDTTAIQAAINSGKVVFLPSFCKTTASLTLKGQTAIVGINEYNAGIVGTGFTYPIFVNDPTSLVDFAKLDLAHFTIRNGTHALKFTVNPTGVQSLGDFRNLRFEFQTTRGVECNYAMIANNFTDCVWFYSVGGIKTGREANLNNFINCRFEGLDAESVIFNSTTPGTVFGGEANRFQGCRFEARNTPAITGNSVIRLDTCTGTVFDSSYFENTFTTILTEVNSNGTTTFQHGRHTGTESDVVPLGFKKDVFVSDSIVNFSGNEFLTGSSGTANMRTVIDNPGLYTLDANLWQENAMTSKKVMSRNKLLTSGVQQSFFRFRRVVLGGVDDRQIVAGVATVVVSGVLTGGTPFFMNRTFNILITGFANATAAAQVVVLAAVDDNAPGAVLSFGTVAGQPTTDIVLGLTITINSLQDMYAHVKLDLVNSFIAASTPFALTCLV